jgi:hypothetical protein
MDDVDKSAKQSQSSLYEDSHDEISIIRTFIMKRIPSVWLVIRNLPNKIEHELTITQTKDATSPSQSVNQGKYRSQFALRFGLYLLKDFTVF